MNEWIRVRDRLPEEKEPVIILLDRFFAARYA